MGFNPVELIGAGIGKAIKDVVGSFKMDPTVKAQLEAAVDENEWKFKLRGQELAGEIEKEITAQVTAQIEVNKLEAQGNLYQSSWRPTVGYICCLGLFFEFFGRPIFGWLAAINGWPGPPALDMGDLIILLGGMLGLGTLRTVDKRGVK